jgi:hypothetical protein
MTLDPSSHVRSYSPGWSPAPDLGVHVCLT